MSKCSKMIILLWATLYLACQPNGITCEADDLRKPNEADLPEEEHYRDDVLVDEGDPDWFYVKLDDKLDYNDDCKESIEFAREKGIVKLVKVENETGEREIEAVPLYSRNQVLEMNVIDSSDMTIYEFDRIPVITCLHQDDPLLQRVLKEFHKIVPPSNEEYNFEKSIDDAKEQTQVAREIEQIVYFGEKKGGFFMEAGAHNFEFDSDTLLFEHDHEWTGLLVEPDPHFFEKGLKKNRKAFAVNTCLSTETRPTLMKFNLGIHSFMNATEGQHPTVMCYPLYSLLMAIGNPTVDYFSLDVEGAEFPILKTIPWDKVDIRAFSIETHFAGVQFPGDREEIINYMKEKGYKHIPYGHQIDRKIIWSNLDNKEMELVNDMFVKENMEVLTLEEVSEIRTIVPVQQDSEEPSKAEADKLKEGAKEMETKGNNGQQEDSTDKKAKLDEDSKSRDEL